MLTVKENYHIDINENGPYTIFSSGEILNYTHKIESTFIAESQFDDKKEVPIVFDYREILRMDKYGKINDYATALEES